jgi:hypothetical protein
MRIAFLAVASACALAACNPSAPSGGPSGGGGGVFPDLTRAAYRAEATIHNEDGTTTPLVMIRDGRRQRMEITAPQGQSTIITNGDTGESFIISSQGGQTMAIRASGMTQQFTDPAEAWGGELATTATRTGSCSGAGQSGNEWTEADGTDTVCVTDDGIILRSTDDGRLVWETTSVQRGPQAASNFELPPGVQVMDMGDMGQAMRDAMAAAKAAQGGQ